MCSWMVTGITRSSARCVLHLCVPLNNVNIRQNAFNIHLLQWQTRITTYSKLCLKTNFLVCIGTDTDTVGRTSYGWVRVCVCNRRWGFHSPFALGQMEMCLHYCSTKRFSIRMCSTKYVSCLLCQSSIRWPLVCVYVSMLVLAWMTVYLYYLMHAQ